MKPDTKDFYISWAAGMVVAFFATLALNGILQEALRLLGVEVVYARITLASASIVAGFLYAGARK